MALENETQKQIWAKLSKLGGRFFRINTGRAWLSSLGPRGCTKTPQGMLIKQPRSIALGFSTTSGESVTGTLDLNGYITVEITPEMVGSKIAVYSVFDAKRSEGGKRTQEQQETIDRVNAAGGIAGFANSPEEAELVVKQWFVNKKKVQK